jgi:shikimate dehydrogenase
MGLKVSDGRTMLLHQGAKAFEIWTGKPAPVEAMRAGLEHAMTIREK